ncbi:hypothetical protein [Nitrospira sp. Nam80]
MTSRLVESLVFVALSLFLWLVSNRGLVQAGPVEVRYPEGISEGFVTLTSLDGKKLGDGELSQIAAGADRIVSRLSIKLKDGSLHDETVVFSQKRRFKLLSYKLLQRGASFPEALDLSLDTGTGAYTLSRTPQDGAQTTDTGNLDLPPDTYNGMTVTLLKNLDPDESVTVHMIDFLPKPKLYEVQLKPVEKEPIRAGGASRDAIHYTLSPQLGWFVQTLASLLGKLPPDYHFWLVKGKVPAFVRFEGPLYTNGPLWRIEPAHPTLSK